MNSNYSILDGASECCATGEACVFPRSCYVEPTPVSEVLFEQLGYLLSHGRASCSPNCAECARLRQVQALLLSPFSAPQLAVTHRKSAA